jgi:16S rRNA processing protein RimM
MKRRRQIPPDQTQQDPSTGSPVSGEPVFLAVGFLRRPHGLEGEILMDVLTDFPERLRSGKTVYVGDNHEPVRIASIRGHNVEKIIRFTGIETPEEAGKFRNKNLFVKAANLPELPEGEYYHHQLIGMNVLDESGQSLGTLHSILETGANDVYLVKTPEGKELLLPAVEDVILEINPDRKEMRVRPPEWR